MCGCSCPTIKNYISIQKLLINYLFLKAFKFRCHTQMCTWLVIKSQYSNHNYCKLLYEQAKHKLHLLVIAVVDSKLCSQRTQQQCISLSVRTDRFLCVFTAKTHTAVCCGVLGYREASPHSSLLCPFSMWQKSWSIVQSQAVLSSTISPFIICRLRQFPCRATLEPEGFFVYLPGGCFC